MSLYLQVLVMWDSVKHGTAHSLTSHLLYLSVAGGWYHFTNGALSTMDCISLCSWYLGCWYSSAFILVPSGLCLPTFYSSLCWSRSSYHSGKRQLEHFSVFPIKVITPQKIWKLGKNIEPHMKIKKIHLFSITWFSIFFFFWWRGGRWGWGVMFCCPLDRTLTHQIAVSHAVAVIYKYVPHMFTGFLQWGASRNFSFHHISLLLLVVGLCWSVCRPVFYFSTQFQLTLS